MEKTFYSFFLQKFFEKYDVLERAIINCFQFSNKKEKRESVQSDSNQFQDYNSKNISNIECVKIQIENILKYIYHESEKSNLRFICDCLVKFCNENRIILIEEKYRKLNIPKLNFINKKESNEENQIKISEDLESNETNALMKRKKLKENIKSRVNFEGQHNMIYIFFSLPIINSNLTFYHEYKLNNLK